MSWKRKALLYSYSRETQGIGSRNQLRQRELVGNVPEASGASLGHLTLAQILKVKGVGTWKKLKSRNLQSTTRCKAMEVGCQGFGSLLQSLHQAVGLAKKKTSTSTINAEERASSGRRGRPNGLLLLVCKSGTIHPGWVTWARCSKKPKTPKDPRIHS